MFKNTSKLLFSLSFLLLGHLTNASCVVTVEEHKENNVGYALGNECPAVVLIGLKNTKLKLIDGAKGVCKFISSDKVEDRSILLISMDISKEDTWMGEGCRVKATFEDGSSHVVSVQSVEN